MEKSFYSHNDPRFSDVKHYDELGEIEGVFNINIQTYIGYYESSELPNFRINVTKKPSLWFRFWIWAFFSVKYKPL